MKRITILGSTGSIGTNALEVIRQKRDEFDILALSGHTNHNLLIKQIKEFNPKYVCVGTKEGFDILKREFPQLEIYFGEAGLKKLGSLEETDIILTAVSGAIGIEATVEAIKLGKKIALANKETMVAAGPYINKLLKKYPEAQIIPVDSEHSALFQAMQAGERKEIARLIITASGGSFRGKTKEELKNVKVEEALKHPNWSMGKKITIDSATLVNKGLEIIEAHELFGIGYDKIEVIIHPQSIIHSMVEFVDRSTIAQMGHPDMKVPIQYAFTYPNREKNPILEPLDFKRFSKLTFEEVDSKTFKGIELAFKAGKIGGTMPAVLNAANEIAVELFLKGMIKFLDIYEVIEEAMKRHKSMEIDNLEVIKKVDSETRKWVYEKFGGK